jgi:small-conductance mechanosensitive channel
MQGLKDRIVEIQTNVGSAIQTLEPELTEMDVRLTQLGDVAEGEAADITQKRRDLQHQRAEVDSAVKRGQLARTTADDLLVAINKSLVETFNRSTFERVDSPLSPSFWRSVSNAFAADQAQLRAAAWGIVASVQPNLTLSNIVLVTAGIAVALLLLGPVRRHLDELGTKLAISRAPNTRLRRSGLAAWFTITGTLNWFLAVTTITLALRWARLLTPADLSQSAARLIGTIIFAGFVVSVGNALLLAARSSWRLLPIDDEAARSFRFLPLVIAVVLAAGIILLDINRIAGMSTGAVAWSNLMISGCYCAMFLFVLHTWTRLEKQAAANGPRIQAAPWMLACRMAIYAVVALTIVSALAGYVNFSLFIGRTIVWMVIVASTTYLAFLVTDDIIRALCAADGMFALSLHSSFGIRPSLLEQAGILVSAAFRISIAFLALLSVSVPFGPGASDLFAGLGDASSITIIGITFEFGALIRAMFVLVISLGAVRLVQRWLEHTYLPATELDKGARNSVLTMFKYAGFILVGLWTISTLGIGIERIALVVSALSVGIGFGLQAITQNFISGLILLAERPLKIGDTVRLGDDEGDVKKISVRSTEIQISDRSTLIVPNSELITKTIRNMTPGEPVGRVEIAFSVPVDSDPQQVRQMIMAIFDDHPGVLDDPKPSVLIRSIADGKIIFESYAFVGSPRTAASVKSALLFNTLEKFRKANIALHTT